MTVASGRSFAEDKRAEIRANAAALGIDEAYISLLVERFYARVRADATLGPIFEREIGDAWDPHLARMKRFWASVALNAGTHAGGPANFTARAMASGSNSLGYQLYLDSGRSSVWGDGTGSSATSSGTGTGSTQTIPIYGRIPSLSGIVPGTYTDTVTVTVTY